LPVHVLYVASLTEGATCALTPAGFTPEGAASSKSPLITGLTKHTKYFVSMCYSNGYGVEMAKAGSITTWEQPAAPGNDTYTYGMAAPQNGQYLMTAPTSTSSVPADFETDFENFDETSGSSVFGADPGVRVRYCTTTDSTLCSGWSAVAAADASRAWQVTYAVNGVNNAGCVLNATIAVRVEATTAGGPAALVTGAEYYVPGSNGRQWNQVAGDRVPVDATQTKNVQWTISWTAPQTSGLASVSGTTQTTAVGCAAATS